VARSYVVEVTVRGAKRDLARLDPDEAGRLRTYLHRLDDDDVHDFEPVDNPDGPRGKWVVLEFEDWRLLAEWRRGRSNLWRLGVREGCLTVHRIIHVDELQRALDAAERDVAGD
jgi:hypothetical protein